MTITIAENIGIHHEMIYATNDPTQSDAITSQKAITPPQTQRTRAHLGICWFFPCFNWTQLVFPLCSVSSTCNNLWLRLFFPFTTGYVDSTYGNQSNDIIISFSLFLDPVGFSPVPFICKVHRKKPRNESGAQKTWARCRWCWLSGNGLGGIVVI